MEKVTINFPHFGKVKRILKQDVNGLYVKYQGQRIPVRPETNCLGEPIPNSYIGQHPKLMKVGGKFESL